MLPMKLNDWICASVVESVDGSSGLQMEEASQYKNCVLRVSLLYQAGTGKLSCHVNWLDKSRDQVWLGEAKDAKEYYLLKLHFSLICLIEAVVLRYQCNKFVQIKK